MTELYARCEKEYFAIHPRSRPTSRIKSTHKVNNHPPIVLPGDILYVSSIDTVWKETYGATKYKDAVAEWKLQPDPIDIRSLIV